jgi:hypothetical protein
MQAERYVELFRPPLGGELTTLLIAAAVLGALAFYLRPSPRPAIERLALLTTRLLAIGLLGWMLSGPSQKSPAPATDTGVRLLLLADTSASMGVCDVRAARPGDDPRTRWDHLKDRWLAPDFLNELSQAARAEFFTFADTLRSVELTQYQRAEPDGTSTNLFEALDKAVRDRGADGPFSEGPAGIILLLSDGHDTQRQDAPALLARLRQLGWPVYAVPTGTDLPARDLALLAWSDSDFLFQGQSTTLHATLTHEGLAGRRAMVNLLCEGESVAQREVTLEAGKPLQVDFPVTPAPVGDAPLAVVGYQLLVEPLDGERYVDNNSRWVFLQVSRQRIRVAIFDGSPYWDTRFLAQALRSDPQIDLTSVFALSEQRRTTVRHSGLGGTAPTDLRWPLTPEQINSFDVIVLGRHCEQFFPGEQARWLHDFVTVRGGALVLARGPAFDVQDPRGATAAAMLAPIEPVLWGRQAVESLRLQLTPAGEASPLLHFEHRQSTDAILTELPGMLAATTIAQEKAASIVLLRQQPRGEAPAMAALAHQNAGSGRVLAVLNEGLWQWAFLPSRLRQFDSIYQQFWSQAVRWLASGGEFLPGQPVSMSLSRLMVEPGEESTVTVTVRRRPGDDWQPQLRLVDPQGRRVDLPLLRPTEQSLRYIATVRPQQAGVHLLELLTPGLDPARLTARLAVYDASLEKLDTSARPQSLQALCAATGGELLRDDDPQRLLTIVEQLRMTRVTQEQWGYIFDWPMVLAAMVLLLGLEWTMRRRQGLL